MSEIEKHVKEKNGITLVALVITVIIIIILATVAISFAFGNNGLINRAEDASGMYANDTAYTEGSITNVESYINDVLIGTGNNGGSSEEPEEPDPNRERFSDIYEATTQYTDSEGNTAWIPQGFAVGVSDGINTINGGLVVTDKIDGNHYSIGNEFVWIPVDDTSLGEMYNATAVTALSKSSSLGEETTTTNVYSNLRVRSGDSGDFSAGTPNSLNIREPDIITDGDVATGISTHGIEAIKSAFELDGTDAQVLKGFAQMLVDEYTATYNSVMNYDGFYIGRYEITGTIAEPTVQKNQAVLAKENWYELKKACNKIVSTDYAQTEMVYGNQWDEIMDWLVDTNEKTNDQVNVDSTAWGNYDDYNDVNGFVEGDPNYVEGAGRIKTSGFCEMWKANNIYDIAGNCWEWTQEAENDDRRTGHGRYDIYGSDAPASVRHSLEPERSGSYYSTRPAMYVK